MWLTNRYGDAYLEIVKRAVETSQHMTALIGSHLSTRHWERASPRLIPVLKCIV